MDIVAWCRYLRYSRITGQQSSRGTWQYPGGELKQTPCSSTCKESL